MVYLLFLDDGHGIETAGKRTPKFPDGTVMRENEFNSAVVDRINNLCKSKTSQVQVTLVAPSNSDVSLSSRVNTANSTYNNAIKKYGKSNVKAAYVSVHANAYKGTEWGTWGGIETFYYEGSVGSKNLATLIHNNLMKGTSLRSRGLKRGNDLYVIRNTSMDSILCECGFMDNLEEAKLLKSQSYRDECASEIFTGICSYFQISPTNSSDQAGGSSGASVPSSSNTGVITADILNVRSGRGTNFSIIGKLKKGDKVKLCYLSNNWWSIDYGPNVGYISSDYVKKN